MNILALEFSTERRSAAVLSGSAGPPAVVSAQGSPRVLNAFALIENALKQARIEREAIECLAVALGPGSYTGIRAAISIAQAWQLGRDVRLLGISSVDCLALQAQTDNLFGRVNFAIDAQRNEFYLATYEISAQQLKVIQPLRLAPFSEVEALVKAGEILAGPELDRWFPNQRILFPDAGSLATLASGQNDFAAGERLEPIYLRETNFVKAPPPTARAGIQ